MAQLTPAPEPGGERRRAVERLTALGAAVTAAVDATIDAAASGPGEADERRTGDGSGDPAAVERIGSAARSAHHAGVPF